MMQFPVRIARALATLVLAGCTAIPVAQSEHESDPAQDPDHHGGALHFSHPLIA